MTTIETSAFLARSDVLEVFELVDAAARADGVTPLSEHVLLHLRHGGDEQVRHLIARDDSGRITGYAHLDATDEVEGPSGEMVVHPRARRHGVGANLVDALESESGDRLRLWAHGHNDAAESMARERGLHRSRVLWQMRRSLLSPLPPAQFPPGYHLRTFEPGVDDEAWLEANSAAFAQLPDQARWTIDDLQRRAVEPWFDPDGFFIATDAAGDLAAFHWTKVHGGEHSHDHSDHTHGRDHGHAPLGEVYVIGVKPQHRGNGLARALLLHGLAHLRDLGLTEAMLYVDATNTAAIRLYSDLGFSHWDTDVLYRRESPGSSARESPGSSAIG